MVITFIAYTTLVLPSNTNDLVPSAIPPAAVTKVALRLKFQIEQAIPCELEEWKIAKANSPVITRKVIKKAKGARGMRGVLLAGVLQMVQETG